jgi:high-affinity nickel permease
MEIVTFSLLAVLFGIRHGMDADHIAAIADMVGSENQKRKQVQLGVMYAAGHGLIVLMMGMLAIFVGTRLPQGMLVVLESLVGISLIVLGGLIVYSLIHMRSKYEYQSRIAIVYQMVSKLGRKGAPGAKLSPVTVGIASAFIIGIIHGIGVETPTQVVVITNAAGLNSLSAAATQLMLFVVGLLLSTLLITLLATWGFMKARFKQSLFFILGAVTGIYSMGLGLFIIYNI